MKKISTILFTLLTLSTSAFAGLGEGVASGGGGNDGEYGSSLTFNGVTQGTAVLKCAGQPETMIAFDQSILELMSIEQAADEACQKVQASSF